MPQKGQALSLEAREQMKETKKKLWKSKMNWSKLDQYLDVEIDNSSRNKKLPTITLRRFKELVDSGMDCSTIIESGISKHLVSFFSMLAREEIIVSKEQFLNDYLSGISLDDMSLKYNMARSNIAYTRQLYDIKVKGATFQKRKQTEVPLSDRQKQIIYGSLMGDAGKMSPSSVKFKHGDAQRDYLMWKYNELKTIASEKSLLGEPYVDERSGYNGVWWRFYTVANTNVEDILSKFYPIDKKIVSQEILKNLTPLSIAVWYMDDGTTDFNLRSVLKNEGRNQPDFKFCTECFSETECQSICSWFLSEFAIKTRMRKDKDRIGHRIFIEKESNDDFVALIRPHVLPMFNYKIDYVEYLKDRKSSDVIMSFAEVKNCPVGDSFVSLSLTDQDSWVSKLITYNRARGFNSLIQNEHDIVDDFKKTIDFASKRLYHEDCIGFSNIGNRAVLSFFPHFWATRPKGRMSPKQVFEDDKYLSEILREIVIQGNFPRRNKILSKLTDYRGNRAVSSFMPCIAKAIYDKYVHQNGSVFDFCCGYGGRLFGALASKNVKSYTGSEPLYKTWEGLHDLNSHSKDVLSIKKDVTILNQDAIVAMKQFSDDVFDFCFTSPPYFDLEEYGDDDPSQSRNIFTTYGAWLEGFLFPSVMEATRICKKVAINISDSMAYPIASDLRKFMQANNIYVGEDRIRYPSRSRKYRYEPILIASKYPSEPDLPNGTKTRESLIDMFV